MPRWRLARRHLTFRRMDAPSFQTTRQGGCSSLFGAWRSGDSERRHGYNKAWLPPCWASFPALPCWTRVAVSCDTLQWTIEVAATRTTATNSAAILEVCRTGLEHRRHDPEEADENRSASGETLQGLRVER